MDGVLLIKPSAADNNSIIIPIEIISNVVLYEDLSIKDVHNYIEKTKKILLKLLFFISLFYIVIF